MSINFNTKMNNLNESMQRYVNISCSHAFFYNNLVYEPMNMFNGIM